MEKHFANHTHLDIVSSIEAMKTEISGVESNVGMAIKIHNDDIKAHPYILKLIEQLMASGGGGGSIDPSVIETMISAHDTSGSSHADIRNIVSQIPFKNSAEKEDFQQLLFDEITRRVNEEVSKIEIPDLTETITTLISNHNSAASSHQFILDLISGLTTKIDELEISGMPPDVLERITTLESGLKTLEDLVKDLEDNPAGSGVTDADVTQKITTHNADSSAHSALKTEILATIPGKVSEATEGILQSHETDVTAHGNIIVPSAEINRRISDHNTSSEAHSDMRGRLQTVEQTVSTIVGNSGISETRASELISEHNVSTTAHDDIRTSIENTKTSVKNVSDRVGAVEGSLSQVPTTVQIDKKISDHNASVMAHPELRNIAQANLQAHNTSDEAHVDIRTSLDDVTSQTSSLTTDVTDLSAKVSLLTSIAEGSGKIDLGTITSTITGSLYQHNKDILAHAPIRASITSTINAVTQISDTLNLLTERVDELPMERAQADMEKIEQEIDKRVVTKIEEHNTSIESHKENILKKLSSFEEALEIIKNQSDIGSVTVEFEKVNIKILELYDIVNALEGSDTMTSAIDAHNTSWNSHPDLRKAFSELTEAFEKMSTGSQIRDAITDQITIHNQNAVAHQDIRSAIDENKSAIELLKVGNNGAGGTIDMMALGSLVDTKISSHNKSTSAHAFLQQKIVSLETTLITYQSQSGGVNIIEFEVVKKTLEELKKMIEMAQSPEHFFAGITNMINEHNRDASSHPAILDKLAELAAAIAVLAPGEDGGKAMTNLLATVDQKINRKIAEYKIWAPEQAFKGNKSAVHTRWENAADTSWFQDGWVFPSTNSLSEVVFDLRLNDDWNSGELDIDLIWTAKDVMAGTVAWKVATCMHTATGSPLWSTPKIAISPAPIVYLATSSIKIPSVSNLNSFTAGKILRIRISRDANNASDNFSREALFLGVNLHRNIGSI